MPTINMHEARALFDLLQEPAVRKAWKDAGLAAIAAGRAAKDAFRAARAAVRETGEAKDLHRGVAIHRQRMG